MNTYFFDTKDGVTVRDRFGVSFGLDSEAIEHSKILARDMRLQGRGDEANLRICVINESGGEVHIELVRPAVSEKPA